MAYSLHERREAMPSKMNSLYLAIGCGVVFLIFAFANVGCLYWPALIGTVIFGATFYFKWQRDQQLISQSTAAQYLVEASEVSGPPPRMSPGSVGLFVPEPHPDDHPS
jgi:hypothetical protein